VLVNVGLKIALMSVDPTFAIPQPVLLKNGATFTLGVNLLSGDFMVKKEQTTADSLAAVCKTQKRDLLISPPLRKALPNFASQVAFQLHPDMAVATVNSPIGDFWPFCAIECTDANLSLVLSFLHSVTGPLGL
jgi:hypothetical protein